MADLRRLAAEVDAVAPERVLVVGSTPEDAGDLDLLVRAPAEAALAAWLPAAGFERLDERWLRVLGGSAQVLELDPVSSWRLPAEQVTALYRQARPLTGARQLALPAPEHRLLVLARRLAASGGRLDVRRVARARTVLAEDPDAVELARAAAADWGCAGSLELLVAALEGRPAPAAERRRALRSDGSPVAPAWREAVRPLVPSRRRRGVVVAVSGLDGSGKSTLTAGLVDALDALDLDAAVLWHRLSYGRLLVLLAAPVKALRRSSRRPAAPPGPEPAERDGAEVPAGGGRAWPLVVTLVHVLTAGPATRWHLRRGRVVVRDRYVLDAAVHLAERYGDAAPRAVHLPLLRRALPQPALAWFLDVPAEEARRRKPEQFTVEQLAGQRARYLELAPLLQVAVRDGTRPVEVLRDEALVELLAVVRRAGLLPGGAAT